MELLIALGSGSLVAIGVGLSSRNRMGYMLAGLIGLAISGIGIVYRLLGGV